MRFGERVAGFVGRLKSALMLLPPGNDEIQRQLEKLPLPTGGLGDDAIAVRDNFGKIRDNVDELITKLRSPGAASNQQAPKQALGERLRQKRADKGHTQAYVAEFVGCDVGTISRIETGRRSVPGSSSKSD